MNAIAPAQIAELPANLEAEQYLLGAVLVNNEAFHAVSSFLEPQHFSEPIHGRIFEAAGNLIREGRAATPVTLKECLPAGTDVVGMSPMQYLARLMSDGLPFNAEDYGRIILEEYQRRALIALAGDIAIQARSREQGLTPEQIIGDVEKQLHDLDGASREVRTVSIADAAANALRKGYEARERGSLITGIPTGLKDIDRATGGLQQGALTLVGARPSMGKSILGEHLCLTAARNGIGALMFSLEMPGDHLGARSLSDAAFGRFGAVAYQGIMAGQKPENDKALEHAYRDLEGLPFEIDERPALSLAQIGSMIRRVQRKMLRNKVDLGLVCIDYLQLVNAGSRYRGDRNNEVGEVSAGLKAMAKQFNVAMVALSQLSRKLEDRADKRPMLSDLRDSGSLEQDADVVIFLYREAYYLERKGDRTPDEEAMLLRYRNDLEAIIAKQRMGPIATVKLFCDVSASAVRDAACR